MRAPGMRAALRRQIDSGTRVHVITTDPALLPGRAESAPDGSETQIFPRPAAPLVFLRADDSMFVSLPIDDAEAPPLLRLQRHQDAGLFDRLLDHFNTRWAANERSANSPQPPASPNSQNSQNAPTPSDAGTKNEPERVWPGRARHTR